MWNVIGFVIPRAETPAGITGSERLHRNNQFLPHSHGQCRVHSGRMAIWKSVSANRHYQRSSRLCNLMRDILKCSTASPPCGQRPAVANIMISVSIVSMRFGAKVLFDEVSTAFTPGKRYGLTGPDGAGKSTFMKLLTGEVEPQKGTVVRPKKLGVLSQDLSARRGQTHRSSFRRRSRAPDLLQADAAEAEYSGPGCTDESPGS